jgi:hypothetical protein
MNKTVKRITRRYIMAQEKSLNLQIDDKFKTWKGKNPDTGKSVSYWTVKGWKQLSKKELAKNPNKAKLKQYAQKAFSEFETKIKGDSSGSSDSESKEIRDSISAMINKPNLGIPKEIYKNNKLALEVEKPSKKDVEKLAEEIKGTFKTPGFERGAIRQLVVTLGTDELNRTLAMAVKPLQGVLSKMSKDDDYKETIREAIESNPEVSGAAKNLSTNWTQSTIAPWIVSSVTGTKATVSIGGGVKALVTAGLSSAGIGGAVTTVAPLVASLAVGAVMYKKLFHSRSRKTKGKLKAVKDRGLPDNYENLASDIYAGYVTPESVEKEYSNKLDAILNDPNMGAEEAREKILELYEDFDTNARPSIDKGIYQLGQTEGSGKRDFLKRGAVEKKGTPVLIKLAMIKDQYDAQDQVAKMMEEDTEEVADMIQKVLTGKEEIPSGLISSIQQGSDKKSSLLVGRVASRYLANNF